MFLLPLELLVILGESRVLCRNIERFATTWKLFRDAVNTFLTNAIVTFFCHDIHYVEHPGFSLGIGIQMDHWQLQCLTFIVPVP